MLLQHTLSALSPAFLALFTFDLRSESSPQFPSFHSSQLLPHITSVFSQLSPSIPTSFSLHSWAYISLSMGGNTDTTVAIYGPRSTSSSSKLVHRSKGTFSIYSSSESTLATNGIPFHSTLLVRNKETLNLRSKLQPIFSNNSLDHPTFHF